MVRIRVSLLAVLVLSAIVFLNPLYAQTAASGSQQCDEAWVARLLSSQGSLSLRRAGVAGVSQPGLNQNFCVGDVLEVGAFSLAALELPDQTVVRIDQGTIITFAAPTDDKRTWLDILKGAIHVISRDPRALRVITPFANAGIEGTEFFVGVSSDATTVIVYEGRVKVENSAGAATAASGESVLARAGSAPVLQQIVRPRDAVVWTLYYPPIECGSVAGGRCGTDCGATDASVLHRPRRAASARWPGVCSRGRSRHRAQSCARQCRGAGQAVGDCAHAR